MTKSIYAMWILCKALLSKPSLPLLGKFAEAVGVSSPVTSLGYPTNLGKCVSRKKWGKWSPIGCFPSSIRCSWLGGSRSRGHSRQKTRCLFLQIPSQCLHSLTRVDARRHGLGSHKGFPRKSRNHLPGLVPCQELPRGAWVWSMLKNSCWSASQWSWNCLRGLRCKLGQSTTTWRLRLACPCLGPSPLDRSRSCSCRSCWGEYSAHPARWGARPSRHGQTHLREIRKSKIIRTSHNYIHISYTPVAVAARRRGQTNIVRSMQPSWPQASHLKPGTGARLGSTLQWKLLTKS